MRGSAGPGGGPMGPGPGGPMSMGPGMPPVSQGNFYAGPPGSGPMPAVPNKEKKMNSMNNSETGCENYKLLPPYYTQTSSYLCL